MAKYAVSTIQTKKTAESRNVVVVEILPIGTSPVGQVEKTLQVDIEALLPDK